jgi:Rad3-related DNA helicase
MPSAFDLSKSPIYYINKHKLSYDKKEESLPKIIEIIDNILNAREDYKGIIQTGSYEFSKYLFDNISEKNKERIMLYEDTNDKRNKLEEFEDSKNKVLIGPSLIEGIDLKDDLCRFIIIMKTPYPSLGDKFVAKKFEVDKNWYMWKTVNSILQGVGRGVRNENDWCETYIIDGTFDNILMNYNYLLPNSFKSRIFNISEYF